MIVKEYAGKYLPYSIVNDCFENGKINVVDKVLAGNGFTTSFLQMNRSTNRTINVLILPNIGAIVSKQNQNKDSRIKFFYSGSGAMLEMDTKIVVCTTDSFKQYLCEQILNKGIRIDRILIDEVHSVIQQATFRKVLKGYLHYIKELIVLNKANSAVCVTATPLINMPINFILKPKEVAPTTIHVNNNIDNVINEIKIKIKNDAKVVVFTNSYKYVMNLAKNVKEKSHLNATIVMGKTLEKKLLKNAPVSNKINSYVISSAGFEGLDLDLEDAEIYILQDLNNDNETFILPNIYQALNRTRKGFKKCTYSRISRFHTFPSATEIVKRFEAILNKKGISPNEIGRKNKLLKLGFTSFEISILFNCIKLTSNRVLSDTAIVKRIELINYYEEVKQFITYGFESKYYKDFLANRNIIIINESLNENNVGRAFSKDKKAIAEHNKDLIIKRGYDKDPFEFNHRNKFKKDIRTDFLKQLREYIDHRSCNTLFKPNYKIEIVQDLLSQSLAGHYTKFNAFIRDIIKEYKATKEIKQLENVSSYVISQKEKDAKIKIERFTERVETNVLRLFGYLLNDIIYIPEHYEENHDRIYNILSDSPMFLIKSVCDLLRINLYELDIVSCNPRIIYSEVGKELPANFYGVDKVNKEQINITLNSLTYSQYVSKCKDEKRVPNTIEVHRNYLQKKLGRLNIDKDVTAWLLDNFHKGYKGQLFDFCTKVERNLIEQVKKQLKYVEVPCFRRHDSLLLFNTEHKIDITNEDVFNNVSGWFNGFKPITSYEVKELDTTLADDVIDDEVEFYTDDVDDDNEVDIFEEIHDAFCSGITLDDAPF